MANVHIRFSSKKVENLNYVTQTPQPGRPLQMQDIRLNMTWQVAKIKNEELFRPYQSGTETTRLKTYNPEGASQPRPEPTPKRMSLRSAESVVSTSGASSLRRRNTFLTVVSRLPTCKKRGSSLF
jgi:hypothetical protein